MKIGVKFLFGCLFVRHIFICIITIHSLRTGECKLAELTRAFSETFEKTSQASEQFYELHKVRYDLLFNCSLLFLAVVGLYIGNLKWITISRIGQKEER